VELSYKEGVEGEMATLSFESYDLGVARNPLLKWPGGKRALLKHIYPLLPARYNRYYEPFLGGGALFFMLQPVAAILADKNAELMNCYLQVRDHPSDVIAYLQSLHNSEQDYYIVRSSSPSSDIERAGRLIYLTTLSFNGIHRVNLAGTFNVPYGYKTHLQACDESKINAASRILFSTTLMCSDFEAAVEGAGAGDLVYLDPPYTVAHGNNGFIKYNAKIFSWDDQIRLASVARALDRQGCHVVISNADHPSIRDLYADFECRIISRASVIAAASEHRRGITECVFYNGR